MNWINVAENLAIALVGVIAGSIITFITITQSNKLMVKQLSPVIEQAIAKETTSIKNEFTTQIKKLKARPGSTVVLEIEPKTQNAAQTQVSGDTLPQEKEGFFKRLFKKRPK